MAHHNILVSTGQTFRESHAPPREAGSWQLESKDENQDGHDGSYVECYLRENEGSSFEDARKQVLHMISDAWEQLNQECLSPNPFSSTFSKASLNIARMVPLMYDYDVNHRLPSLEEHMKSLFYENVSVKKEEKAHDSIL
ncbi:hypothetical protein NC652_027356 [Populus alba x Populus x berolinensis]|nr:hypothetical protein NC652_027356 [Populus alba x Populus x berolinensis]